MIETPIAQLVSILTASIAPVIVISGVGLLLLSMTNRYSRVIDRAREMAGDLTNTEESKRRELITAELKILYRRARILRVSILLSAASILFVGGTVCALFATLLLGLKVDYVAMPLFGLSLSALIASLYFFIRDLTISLIALELEISPHVARSTSIL